MNERIAELREQAHELCKKYDDDCGSDLVKTDEVFQKFAELIVRECMRMCDVAAVGYESHNLIKEANGCVLASKYIAEHFGVE